MGEVLNATVCSLIDSYVVWSIVDACLFLVIICGNVLTILAIRLCRPLRNVTSNQFILSLAVSDFFVGLTLPYHLSFYISPDLSRSKVTCIARFVLISFACCASIYNVIAIAIDRYVSIVYPMSYARYMTRRVVCSIIISGWMIALGIAIIPIFWNHFDEAETCQMDTILPKYYTGWVLTPMMLLTWIIMFLLYWRIWKEASTHARRLRDKSLYNDVPSDWKSVQVVFLVMGCFSICWLPYLTVACVRAFHWSDNTSATLYEATFSLAIGNSGMNPVIYAWKNANFRKAFNRLLHFEAPNQNQFNSSLKNYLKKQKDLDNNESANQHSSSNGIKTICDNYTFESEESVIHVINSPHRAIDATASLSV